MIKSYITGLSKEDLINYIENNNLDINKNDYDIIYYYIKNYYNEIINNDTKIFIQIKKEVNDNTYNTIINLYKKYRVLIN